MDWQQWLFSAAFLIVASAINGALGDAMVTGTVLCDQCRDGEISLFDYPLSGIKVAMACPGNDGQLTMWREETTNWLGNYAIKFDGTPDLNGCYAEVSGSGQGDGGCRAAAGPARYLRLMFRMFDMEFYTVDPLLSQPAQPMSSCPRSAPSPSPPQPPTPTPSLPPPLPPPVRLPPSPGLPPLPPMPFLEASACPYQNWIMPEYRCYWKIVSPEMKVGLVFGLIAARKYGPDMTLRQAMEGRGDPYRTLLREATTSLLNSYNSLQFPYNPLGVIQRLNQALTGSTRQILLAALRFKKANSGASASGNVIPCRFKPCK